MSRARRLWTRTGAIVLLGLAVSYLVACLTYGLAHGDMWNVGEGAGTGPGSAEVAVHEFRAGKSVQIAVTVRNPGPLPVTLEQVTVGSSDLAVDAVSMIEHAGRTSDCCLPQDARPFRPVSIGPDDQIMIWLTLRVTGVNPYPECSGPILRAVDLRYRVLFFPRKQSLPLETEIAFRTPCRSPSGGARSDSGG